MNPYDKAIEDYACKSTRAVDQVFRDLKEETYAKMSNPRMQVGEVQGTFLRLLVAMIGARRVLEFGTFTGYSAMMMASVLPPGGVLYTLDRDPEAVEIAKRYFARVHYGKKIKVIMGDARVTVQNIKGPIDLAFIDADKEAYDLYYEATMKILRPGGIIALDNMLWYGKVLDPPADDKDANAIVAMNEKINNDRRVENVLLTVRDGVMLVRKLPKP
ncbi:MAG: class I SAM-dependent methyltransferase [Methanomassiliicoccales archaeon]